MFQNLKKKFKKNEDGLTLVELLAVVVILAIVSAIAFVIIGNVIANSKKDAHIANAQQIISSVKLAEASGDVGEKKENGIITVDVFNDINTIAAPKNPFTKEDYTGATVTKSAEGSYSITMDPTGTANDCAISETTESDLQGGRDKVCDS